jgi:putative peptidoglycan lipid II flippase
VKAFSQQTIFSGTVINVGSRSLGRVVRFALIILISLKFGASDETDAYFVVQPILLLFLSVGDRILNLIFIPVFVDYRKNKGDREAWSIANSTFAFMSVCLFCISIFMFVFAPHLASILATGFSEKAVSITILLIRVLSPAPFLVGLSAIPAAIFYSYRSFMIPAITGLFYGGGAVTLTLLLADKLGIMSVLIGSIAGVGLQTLILVCILKKKEKRFNPSWNLNHPGVIKVGALAVPRLFAFVLPRLNIMVDRFFASGLGVGYVSCLSYAHRVFEIPSALLAPVFGRVFMPVLSEHGACGAQEEIRKFVSKGIRLIAFAVLPFTIIFFVFHRPLIRLLFQRGAFDFNNTHLAATALLFYNIGLLPFCINIVLLGVFYALQDSITPLKISAINFVLNILLDLILVKWLGLTGIPLATSLIAMLNAAILLILLGKKVGYLDGRKIFASLLKVFLAGIATGFVLWFALNNLSGVTI